MQTANLNIHWAFGFSKDAIGSVHSLCAKDRNALFLISSHSGVVYDFEHRTQTILQGHCNVISCCVVDKSKRWIVTADSGYDSIMIVWDAFTFVPVKSYSIPHENGIAAVDISDDALFIATLSAPSEINEQQIAIWAWTTDDNGPILRSNIDYTSDFHTSIKFNPKDKSQIVTNSYKSVCFWNWNDFHLECYYGQVSKTDLGNYSGNFVSSVFLPDTENAITATSEGYVIIWEAHESAVNKVNGARIKVATKALKLMECGITLMETTSNGYLSIACTDGAVRFYDFFLRLEAWFEDLAAGTVTSVSFSEQACPYPRGEAGAPGLKFWVPDFIVGTVEAFIIGVESSLFDEVRKEDRRGTLLMQGLVDSVIGVACHPKRPLVALLCSNGVLQVWDYELKLLMMLREFNQGRAPTAPPASASTNPKSATGSKKHNLNAKCVAFDPSGAFVAIGFTSGIVKILNTETLEDVNTFSPSSDSIDMLKFSVTGAYLAGCDSSHHVILFSREQQEVAAKQQDEALLAFMQGDGASGRNGPVVNYTYIGRCLSHTARISGLDFVLKDSIETLISVAEDRFCVEYDLAGSSMSTGVQCISTEVRTLENESTMAIVAHRVEMAAMPTAVMNHPRIDDDVEDRFVIANTEFKFKEFNVDSKHCRKTTIAPRFGSPPTSLVHIPYSNVVNSEGMLQASYFAFATPSRVIGIGSFPLTGDPTKTMGIVAHPNEVTSMSVSFDGKYVFSTGGADLSANMWRIDYSMQQVPPALAPSAMGMLEDTTMTQVDQDLAPFLALLEGGETGELYQDMVDYFYYCQLRNLGEDSIEARTLTGSIPLEEIPSFVRAIGYYPTEEEVSNMINEIRYKRFMVTGELQNIIGFNELVKLYINHRPAIPLDKQLISSAFAEICSKLGNQQEGDIFWERLKYCLTNEGEKISPEDLDAYLLALTGSDAQSLFTSSDIDAKAFAENVLGFEDFGNMI